MARISRNGHQLNWAEWMETHIPSFYVNDIKGVTDFVLNYDKTQQVYNLFRRKEEDMIKAILRSLLKRNLNESDRQKTQKRFQPGNNFRNELVYENITLGVIDLNYLNPKKKVGVGESAIVFTPSEQFK